MKHMACASILCIAALSVLSGCSFKSSGTEVKGSGIVKTETREVAGFTSISFQSMGKVTVQQTGRESVTIRAEDNILPLLETRVSDHTLHLGILKDADIAPTQPIEFAVEVKNLESLDLSGAGNIDAKGIQGKQLSVSVSGVGNVTVAGSADALNLQVSGVGNYQGEDFKTRRGTVRNSGVGHAVVNVSDQLEANVSGVGSVEYVGSPQVQESVSGVGRVKRR